MAQILLLEAGAARYFVHIKRQYVPITGGINTDVSLVREEKPVELETPWEWIEQPLGGASDGLQ